MSTNEKRTSNFWKVACWIHVLLGSSVMGCLWWWLTVHRKGIGYFFFWYEPYTAAFSLAVMVLAIMLTIVQGVLILCAITYHRNVVFLWKDCLAVGITYGIFALALIPFCYLPAGMQVVVQGKNGKRRVTESEWNMSAKIVSWRQDIQVPFGEAAPDAEKQ